MSDGHPAGAQLAADGHEHLGGIHADLVAPRAAAIAQRVDRARMWVGSHFALIARHRAELLLERLRDIDPRIRDERARVAPLRAARRVEHVYGLDERFERPGG